ncbi:hypothetical protein C8J57DRAFT_1298085 [Mycena rebaudengoi]|nr:hypothetical protein C8J57DRAFT_1298085 [Mycena rebaudengoi]
MNFTKTPPHDAFIGQACLKCFKRAPRLLRCAGCRLASYCSPECQKADWIYPIDGTFTNDHKHFCNAVRTMDRAEKLPNPFPPYPMSTMLIDERIDDELIERRKKCLSNMGTNFVSFVETRLLGCEPRCLACGVAQRHVRKAISQGIQSAQVVVPCADCLMSYFCSDVHQEFCRKAHSVDPLYGGYDGLTECALNRQMRQHLWCEDVLNRKPNGWNYRPSTIHPAWKLDEHGAETLLRVHTECVSPVMSSLYAFELLYKGSAWTERKKLTIHILASGAHDSVMFRFEEMIHRLPALQELTVHYFGYNKSDNRRRSEAEIARSPAGTLCSTCKATGKSLILKFDPLSMEYAKWLRKQKAKPDLVIAHSLERLVMLEVSPLVKARGIATFFTSPQREMAEALYQVLAKENETRPDVMCGRNPWGSLRLEPAPNRVTGVHSTYGWMLGGYKARDI